MQSLRIPTDAADIAAYAPFLANGIQPGESVVIDDDGVVLVCRYPANPQAERLAAALRDARGGV